MNNTILLNSGKYFDFADIENQMLDIEDIAHGLAMSCRFGGQCDEFYSIAEHSYYVSLVVPPEFALCGLLHDATESVMTDIPKPFKVMLKEYGQYELALETTLAKQYNIPFPYPPEIKYADKRMLITERDQLFKTYCNSEKEVWNLLPPYSLTLQFWTPKQAKEMFLLRYNQLTRYKDE